jgi:hypothetical protein
MVRPILRQQWRRHELRLRLLRAVHDDSTWGRCLVCTESVERGVWPGKKRSGSPGLVGRERIAPLVAAQGCWCGVITFVPDQRKFEVEGCRCSDAQKYHLEFDSDLKLIAKRLVR